MTRPIESIRNIGPKTAQAFQDAGLSSAEEIEEMGADAAYKHLLEAGTRPHFIAYYVLVMGLQNRPWNDFAPGEKEALRARFDALVASTEKRPEGIDAALDMFGVGRDEF